MCSFWSFLAKNPRKAFTVVGDGRQTRDFTFVSMIDAIFLASESNLNGEIINIGSDNTYSVNRLVELLKGDSVYIPKRPGELDCMGNIDKKKHFRMETKS